jgi:hypothetical protein
LTKELSSFLSSTQIAAVLRSSGFIAQLPSNTRNRIGESFGSGYNKQFQIMLAFTGLNIIITVILVFVRKRLGIFGTMPVRKDGNEFNERAEGKSENSQGVEKQADITTVAVEPSSYSSREPDRISVAVSNKDTK